MPSIESPRPIPKMYLKRKDAEKYRRKFMEDGLFHKSKYKLLLEKTGYGNRDYQIPYEALKNLILHNFNLTKDSTGRVSVNLAMSDKLSNNHQVPQKRILLLFSANTGKMKTPHFFLPPGASEFKPLESAEASLIINDYRERVLPVLDKSIDLNAPYNNIPNSDKFSDTQTIFYKAADFYDTFIEEAEHQLKENGYTFVRSDVYLSAYSNKGIEEGGLQKYKRRLIIQFDIFVRDSEGNIFSLNLEVQPSFGERMKEIERLAYETVMSNNKPFDKFFDKGHLCPDICPDGDDGK